MPRPQPHDDAGRDFIQFRGRQTSVVHDQTGVRFGTEVRDGRRCHAPVPVVPDDTDPSAMPADGVIMSVAEHLTESNPLINWGIACSTCGAVFPDRSALSGHQASHDDADAAPASPGDR